MIESMSKFYRYLRKRYNSFESVFQVMGGMAGVTIAIVLLATGVAAIPFTGGTSMLPIWLGGLIFFGIVSTTFLAAGRFLGITLDATISAITDGDKSNNEKLATAVAFCVSALFVGLAVPFGYVFVPYIATAVAIPFWEAMLIFVPATLATLTAIGRHIGRTIDKHVRLKVTVADIFTKDPAPTAIHSNLDIATFLQNAEQGIENYRNELALSRDQYFDPVTKESRAEAYLQLLQHDNVDTDLQKAILVYTLLKGRVSTSLKESVAQQTGYQNVKLAKKEVKEYIESHVGLSDMKFLKENVVSKISMFTDRGKKLYKNNDMKSGYRIALNNLCDTKFRN